MGNRRVPGWVFPAVGVALIVVLVAIGLNRGPIALDPDSPQGTVQTFIKAVIAEDYAAAAALWDTDQGCIPDSQDPGMDTAGVSVSLISVDSSDSEATVRVRVEEPDQDPLSRVSDHEEWFQLVKRADGWRIQQPSWPYYFETCESRP